MIPRISRLFAGLVSGALFLGSAGFAQQSNVAPRITAKVDTTQRVTLEGSVPGGVFRSRDLGELSPSQNLQRMVLVLQRSDAQQADLDALVAAQNQQGSDQFHKWLTPEQFQGRFSPAAEDIAQVKQWLVSQGFSNVTLSRGGQRIEFSGPVSSVETAFRTSMHQYTTPTLAGTEQHIANATPVSIPAALSPVVKGVLSLHNFVSHPQSVMSGVAKQDANGKIVRIGGDATSTTGNGTYTYALGPADLRTIYGASALPADVNGTGVSISVIGRTDIQLSDIQAYRAIFSLPLNDPNIIVSGPDPGVTGDIGESSLDLEVAGAIAPMAMLNFVTAGSTDTTDGIDLAAAYAVENLVSPIITVSYGACEKDFGPSGNQFIQELWEQAAAEGISVFIATGDTSAAQCDGDAGNSGPAIDGDSVNGLASTPYNVAVGGTQFAEGTSPDLYWDANNAANLGSAKGYIPEGVWSLSCDPTLAKGTYNCSGSQTNYNIEGGGGGRSNCAFGTQSSGGVVTCTGGYPKPAWQKGTGVPSDGVRDLPDVSLNASPVDDPYMLCYAGNCVYTTTSMGGTSVTSIGLAGGTSAPTPLMAGIMALVEQQNGTFLGLPNYNLYALAAQSGSSCSSSSRTDPTQSPTCIFNDVTVGNDSAPGLPGWGTATPDFTAAAGYDLATGWGSVNIANLVNNWTKGNASSTSTTSLTATSTTAVHGQSVPLSVKVASLAGTPTGDIQLLSSSYGAADYFTLTSGAWSGSVSDLPGGTYQLTARYAGDVNFSASTSAPTTLTISPEASSATLVVSTEVNNVLVPVSGSNYYGTYLYLKGYVSGTSGQGTATGTVTAVMDGTTTLVSAPLTSNSGYLLETQAVPVGNHSITLQYSGDNSFDPGKSAPVPVTMTQGQTVTYPSIYGVPSVGGTFLLAVTVTGSGAILPTGTVQFYDSGVAIGTPQTIIYNGVQGAGYAQASIQYTVTTAGKHTFSVGYSGDTNYLSVPLGSSFAYTRTITLGGTIGTTPTVSNITMTSSPTLSPGQIARFVITVNSGSSSVTTLPAGTVYAIEQNGVVGYVNPLSSGVLNASLYVYTPGTYTLKAYYPGSSTFAPSTSTNSITYTVSQLTPTTTFSAGAANVLPNTEVSLNFRTYPTQVNSSQAEDGTGTVTFTDSVNGATGVSLGTFTIYQVSGGIGGYSGRFVLPVGSNVITAAYSGNIVFTGNTSTTTVMVGSPGFTITSPSTGLTISAGTTGSATLALTPTLGYTGSLSLACSGAPVGSVCTVNPATGTFGGVLAATVSVATSAPSPTAMLQQKPTGIAFAMAGLAGGALLLFLTGSKRRRWIALLPVALVSVVLLAAMGCAGSGSGPSTPAATLLSVSSSGIKTASGIAVTFTAKLNALNSNPTGTVTFYDGTTALGSAATLTSGTATLQSSSLAVGSHAITATYSGDSNNVTSTSNPIMQVITGTTTLQVTATSGTLVHTLGLPVTLN